MRGAQIAGIAFLKTVTTGIISKICQLLDCQPGDIMEFTKDEPEDM